jgi:hypothetical protein
MTNKNEEKKELKVNYQMLSEMMRGTSTYKIAKEDELEFLEKARLIGRYH